MNQKATDASQAPALRDRIALTIAWIALITAIVGLLSTIVNFALTYGRLGDQGKRLEKQERQIEQLGGCYGVTAYIEQPTDGEPVGEVFFVSGKSTPSDVCRYVFVVARDVSSPAWHIADLVQADSAGKWSGQVRLRNIANVGADVELTVRITSRSNEYSVLQVLSVPPEKGVMSSNIVRVRRTE